MSKSILSAEEIQKILPHRYPFQLLDRVIERSVGPNPPSREGGHAVAIKNVTINEQFFQGHFPGRPIMPGVLIVEAMAQASALSCYRDGEKAMSVMIASIEKVKFRRPVVPGDQLRLVAKVKRDRGKMILFGCEAFVDDQLAAQADILAHVVTNM